MSEILASESNLRLASWRTRCWVVLFGLVVALMSSQPFLPALSNEFVNWDDPGLILENQQIRGLAWDQIKWMFTSFHLGPYQPLAWMSLALDYMIWGLNPLGFHLSSLLWHIANAVCFYALTRRILIVSMPKSISRPGSLAFCAAFAAMLFAAHPFRVESVAWASERRDVMAAFFGICTVWAYLQAVQSTDNGMGWSWWKVISLVAFLFSLLSKASTLFLPAVLSVLDFYPLGRLTDLKGWISDPRQRRIWAEKIPFWILSLLAGLAAIYGQRTAGGMVSFAAYSLIDRCTIAGFGLSFYLCRTFFPTRLSPVYELPDHISLSEARFFLGVLVTLSITIAVIRFRRRLPGAFVAWVCFVILILPVSGLAQTGTQLVADRYSYFPCLSFAMLFGGLILSWLLIDGRVGPRVGIAAGFFVACSLSLSLLSWRQTKVWHDSQTLWKHALTIEPASAKALANLGCAYATDGDFVSAREYLEQADRIRPGTQYAHVNLGFVLRALGHSDLAIQQYNKAWACGPGTFEIANSLGLLYQEKAEWAESLAWYERALKFRRDWPSTLTGLGSALTALGQLDRAILFFEHTLRIDATRADAHNGLGIAFRRLGKADRAEEHLLRAWELQPDSADICYNLGYLKFQQENWPLAIEWYERTLNIDPGFVKAINDLGIVNMKLGQVRRAIELYRESLKIDPGSTSPRFNLAIALTEQGLVSDAEEQYRHVLMLQPHHSAASINLAQLLERSARYREAVVVLQDGMNHAPNHKVLLYNLSRLLSAAPDNDVRDGTAALKHVEQLLASLDGRSPDALDVMAAAYAELGRFREAIELATQAAELATEKGNSALELQIKQRLKLYSSGQPFRCAPTSPSGRQD